MYRVLCIVLLVVGFVFTLSAQRKMVVENFDNRINTGELGENEAAVVVKTALSLSFESTMDKTVDQYRKEEVGDTVFFYLKFNTQAKYRGRKLKMKADNFDVNTYPLELKAGDVLALYVFDPDSRVSCFYQNQTEGNTLFQQGNYLAALAKYQEAKVCADVPAENEIEQKMENTTLCRQLRQSGDSLINRQDYYAARPCFEKIAGLNPLDSYATQKVELCAKNMLEQSRFITGKATLKDGKALEKVIVSVLITERKKNGEIKVKERKEVGRTDANGNYKVSVKYKYDMLEFKRGKVPFWDETFLVPVKLAIAGDTMDVVLSVPME